MFDIFYKRGPIRGMNLVEIGQLVHARRTTLGLSQARLAALGGLSRATINQLENGTLVDLGAAKLLALLDLLGIGINAATRKRHIHALLALSQTASVSYRTTLQPQELAESLVKGTLPESITPHVATLLDEAPLPLIVAAVEEVAVAQHCAPKALWKSLVQWAQDLHSPRSVWA